MMQDILNGGRGITLAITAQDLEEAMLSVLNRLRMDSAEAAQKSMERPSITPEQACKALHTTKTTLWRWARRGFLKPVKVGGKSLYRASDIEAVLEKGGAR